MRLTNFHHGDQLVIRPSDYRDPIALQRAGETCVFDKYSKGAVGIVFAIVVCPDGRRLYMRQEDVVRANEQLSMKEVAS